MPINSEQVLRKMNEIQSKGGEPVGHWHSLRQWLLEDKQVEQCWCCGEQSGTHESWCPNNAVDVGRGDETRKGVYCRNCEAVIEFGEMKPFRKDDDTVDMLCSGCDETLVEGE